MLHQTMTYSKIHQKFSNYLKQPDVRTNPEKYLGPNWEDVLNFWIYVDTLSVEEMEEIGQRYRALDEEVRISAIIAACDAAEEVVGLDFRYDAWFAAYDVTGSRVVFSWATYELIGHHKLLEQNKTPLALQYCIKP
jgi:hypothetical protein